MTRSTPIPKLVQFGAGGDSVQYGRYYTCSGYGTPESPHAAAPETVPDGTPVIDKRAAIKTPEGYSWVFRGPMVNVDLPPGGQDRCLTINPLFASAMAENEFGGLLALQTTHLTASEEPGPLDCVSIAEYIAGWREHGARIGTYQDGRIVWEVK